MWLIPYRRIDIQSPLSAEEVVRRLSTATDPRRWWSSMQSEKYFRGSVSDTELRLIPVIEGRNSYLPVLHGDMTPAGTGTEVRVSFALHPLAVGWIIIFLTAPFFAYRERKEVLIIPLIVLGFHILFYYTGFLPEVRRAERFLRDLLGVYD